MDPQLIGQLCSGNFRGSVIIQNFWGTHIDWDINAGFEGVYPHDLKYSPHASHWDLQIATIGSPWYNICRFDGRAGYNNQTYYWKCDLDDSKAMDIDTSRDGQWPSFKFEPHPQGGVAIRSGASGQLVCAEPSDHQQPYFVANRDNALEWERFNLY